MTPVNCEILRRIEKILSLDKRHDIIDMDKSYHDVKYNCDQINVLSMIQG